MEDILQVPLLEDVEEDIMVWKDEQNGIYNVHLESRFWRSLCRSNVNEGGEKDWFRLCNIKSHLESNISYG